MDRSTEVGITNLGPVPEGMAFLEAVASVEGQRKHDINPEHQSKRLTLCEALREIWRIAEWCESPAREDLQMLAGFAFDCGKRMDARMKELREMIP